MGMLHAVARRATAKIILVLVLGVIAGLIVGGAFRLLGPENGDGAHAATPGAATAAPATPAPPPPTSGAAALRQGRVAANDAVGRLTAEVSPGTVRTSDGAVAAFTAYATWLIGSPAAHDDPVAALRAVGSTLLNPVDARQVTEMSRKPGDGFAASAGAYRVLGRSGDAAEPAEVMVEVTAPLTVNGRTRWSTVGGVVAWTADGWQLVSIRPVDVPQPKPGRSDIRAFTPAERSKTFAGLGWQAFALPAER